MGSIKDSLKRKGVLLSDGGWGSQLIALGLEVGASPEAWNLDRPEEVLAVAATYVEAGSDLITTNTFGGNRFRLAHYGLEARAAEINKAGAALSRKAAGADRHVHASIGPSGIMLMEGTVSEDALEEAFAEQAVALESGGADACLIETMSDVQEACAAVRAAKENTQLEIVCTFTFQRGPDESYRTMMGTTPEAAATAVLEAGADIIGANCTLGPAEMVDLVRVLRAAATGTPILVQPNAGQPAPVPGGIHYPETAESMASYVVPFIEAGANILGGCCGTTPAHIAAMRKVLDGLRP